MSQDNSADSSLPLDCGRPAPNLLLGYRTDEGTKFGFHTGTSLTFSPAGSPVIYAGREHVMTVAPTGAGKGRNCIISNLLRFTGTTIVLDPKAELYYTTHRFRRSIGHRVIKLDPFRLVDDDSDSLNPFDVFSLPRADVEIEAQTLAAMLSTGHRFSKDPFWDNSAGGLVSGVIAYLAGTKSVPSEDRNLDKVCDLLTTDDVVYNLAVLLDTVGKEMPRLAYREISSFLQQSERETRPSILGTAQNYLKAFGGAQVSATLKPSSFNLADIVQSKPVTIYLIIPPDRIDSHKSLIRLWVATLLKAVLSRRGQPKNPTLFLLDEVAQLGNFPILENAMTLGRGYGLCCWLFLQDLAQLQTHFPTAWRTMVNNSSVFQTFGLANHMACTEVATLLAHGPSELASLRSNEQLLRINGEGELRCRRLDYLTDTWCQGRYDENPFGKPGDDDEEKESRRER